MGEKRKFIRYDSIHLLDYLILEDDETTTTYSMGRTIDVSKAGLKLETTQAFEPGTRLEVTVGLEDDLIELVGTVMHCRKTVTGRFQSGIAFERLGGEHKRIYMKYMDAFQERKKQGKI